ncbi:MAG: phosphopantothenoylcysteine decarboxylase, partial [Paramuribaculum sp.]|nr:phosphopantothenoylcysteine decarboxylase [Paramuribaculum sp.]
LETADAAANGRAKLAAKNLDMIVVNSLADAGAGFGTDTNVVTIIDAATGNARRFPLKSKRAVAADILDAVESAQSAGKQ